MATLLTPAALVKVYTNGQAAINNAERRTIFAVWLARPHVPFVQVDGYDYYLAFLKDYGVNRDGWTVIRRIQGHHLVRIG